MTKKEQKEFNDLKLRIENWLVRANEHNYERQLLQKEKKQLLKEIKDLEKKYEVKDVLQV